jgi:hypothetical protein
MTNCIVPVNAQRHKNIGRSVCHNQLAKSEKIFSLSNFTILTFPYFMILLGRIPPSQLTDNVHAMSVSTEKTPKDRSAKSLFIFCFILIACTIDWHKKHYANYA